MTISLEDFAEHLGKAVPADPVQLQRHLDAAIEIVESRCGPLSPKPTTYRVGANGCALVVPATHLTGVTQVRDPDGNVVEHVARRTNLLAGIIEIPRRQAGLWEVDVVQGDATTPASLDLAVLIIGKHLWEAHRGNGSRSGALADPAAGLAPTGFAIPRRAAELMRPFEQLTTA